MEIRHLGESVPPGSLSLALNESERRIHAATADLVAQPALMAWLLRDEVPPLLSFVGGALCIAGVLLARRTARV